MATNERDADHVTRLLLEATCWPPEASALIVRTPEHKVVVALPAALARVVCALGELRRQHDAASLHELAGWTRVKRLPQLLVRVFGDGYGVAPATVTRYLRRISQRYAAASRRQLGADHAAPPFLEHAHEHGVRLVCTLALRCPGPASELSTQVTRAESGTRPLQERA